MVDWIHSGYDSAPLSGARQLVAGKLFDRMASLLAHLTGQDLMSEWNTEALELIASN